MRKTTIVVALVAATSLAACTTSSQADLARQVDAACARARAVLPSIQVLYDAGVLSAKGRRTFVAAKSAISNVCEAPPTDLAGALLAVTTTYVAIKQLLKEAN